MTAALALVRRPFIALWTLAMLLSVSIAVVSYRYLPRIGPLSPEILANLLARPFLDLHVIGAATALLVGPFQFLASVRNRRPGLHRALGKVYVAACLLGGVAGFVLAFGSTAGPIATAGFATLAVCWVTATSLAWRRAVQRDFAAHRVWMIRSWAMTFAAVTLRLYLPLIPLTGMTAVEGYRLIAWMCWIGNLAVAELWLRRQRPDASSGMPRIARQPA